LEAGETSMHGLQRKFKEETGMTITVGSFLGCLECYWQEGQECQEFDLIFAVNTNDSSDLPCVQSLESHISFSWLPLTSSIQESYKTLPAGIIKYLVHPASCTSYIFRECTHTG
jgi:hypothetical protein